MGSKSNAELSSPTSGSPSDYPSGQRTALAEALRNVHHLRSIMGEVAEKRQRLDALKTQYNERTEGINTHGVDTWFLAKASMETMQEQLQNILDEVSAKEAEMEALRGEEEKQSKGMQKYQ